MSDVVARCGWAAVAVAVIALSGCARGDTTADRSAATTTATAPSTTAETAASTAEPAPTRTTVEPTTTTVERRCDPVTVGHAGDGATLDLDRTADAVATAPFTDPAPMYPRVGVTGRLRPSQALAAASAGATLPVTFTEFVDRWNCPSDQYRRLDVAAATDGTPVPGTDHTYRFHQVDIDGSLEVVVRDGDVAAVGLVRAGGSRFSQAGLDLQAGSLATLVDVLPVAAQDVVVAGAARSLEQLPPPTAASAATRTANATVDYAGALDASGNFFTAVWISGRAP